MSEMIVQNLSIEGSHLMRQEFLSKIEDLKALERLEQNADFKRIFKDLYGEKEAIRLTHMLADVTVTESPNREAKRHDIVERLMGIARFARFFRQVENLAMQAEKGLVELAEAEAAYYAAKEQPQEE